MIISWVIYIHVDQLKKKKLKQESMASKRENKKEEKLKEKKERRETKREERRGKLREIGRKIDHEENGNRWTCVTPSVFEARFRSTEM